MRYLAGLVVVLLLFLLDVALVAALLYGPVFVDEWPFCYRFAQRVWSDKA